MVIRKLCKAWSCMTILYVQGKSTFPGSLLSWEVYFPGKSTSPGNLLSWGIKIPGKSQALHAHGVLSREVSFSRTSTFLGSLLSRSAWINKDFVITYFNSMQHSKHWTGPGLRYSIIHQNILVMRLKEATLICPLICLNKIETYVVDPLRRKCQHPHYPLQSQNGVVWMVTEVTHASCFDAFSSLEICRFGVDSAATVLPLELAIIMLCPPLLPSL